MERIFFYPHLDFPGAYMSITAFFSKERVHSFNTILKNIPHPKYSKKDEEKGNTLMIMVYLLVRESESHSVMSDSWRPHGLYSPWNSLGQNTGVGNLSLLQGIFPTQVSGIAGGFFTSWATREAQEHRSG